MSSDATRATPLIFGLLGPVTVWSPDGTIRLGEPRQRAVLSALVLHVGHVVTVPRLAALVWGDRVPTFVRKAIQVYVSQLRRLIVDLPAVRLTTQGDGYRMECLTEAVDLHRFRQLVSFGRNEGVPARRRLILMRALELWRGAALAGTSEAGLREWFGPALEEERLTALEDLYDTELQLGAHAHAVGPLRALLAEHPTRERLASLLMVALQRCGRAAEAAEVFRGLRQRLVGDVGMEPSRALLALHRTILSGEIGTPPSSAVQVVDHRRGQADGVGLASATHLGVFNDLGERHLSEGDLDRALAYFHAARALARDCGDPEQWARADRSIAGARARQAREG